MLNKNKDFIVRLYDQKYKEGILDLQKIFHPNINSVIQKKDFEWLYEYNPYCNELDLKPLFVAINRNGLVIGVRGYCLLKYNYEDLDFYSLGASGAIVHSDYRGMGIFDELNKFSINYLKRFEQIKTILNLSSNKYSTPGYLKLGWEPLSSKTYLLCYNPFFIKNNNTIKKYIKKGDYELVIGEPNNSMSAKYSSLFNCNNKISLKRDEKYFNWRFNRPGKTSYYASLYFKGKLIAYSVIQNKKSNFKIIEYKYSDYVHFKYLIEYLKIALPYKKISVWRLSRTENEINILFSKGFIHVNKYISKFLNKPKQRAVIRPNVGVPEVGDWFIKGNDIRKPKYWDIYYSDVDSI